MIERFLVDAMRTQEVPLSAGQWLAKSFDFSHSPPLTVEYVPMETINFGHDLGRCVVRHSSYMSITRHPAWRRLGAKMGWVQVNAYSLPPNYHDQFEILVPSAFYKPYRPLPYIS